MTEKIKSDRITAIKLLYCVLIASALLPAALIAYGVWTDRQATYAAADERISKSLAVLHEQALKVFESVELALQNVDDLLLDLTDEEIRQRGAELHNRFKRLRSTLGHVQSVWALSSEGNPLVTSIRYPAPLEVSFADRDYFVAQKTADRGTFISEVLGPRIADEALFSITRRRENNGQFNGIVGSSLLPKDFRSFYAEISGGGGDYFAMIRENGTFLVRYPLSEQPQVAAQSAFLAITRQNIENGIWTFPSRLDGRDRRLGWRKIKGYPIYVLAGRELSAINSEWFGHIRWYLALGLPTQALVLALVGVAIGRTRRLYAEAERRVAAETALRQSQRMEAIGQLTGGVAHDFNNLLMVMSGAVDQLKRRITDTQYARSFEMLTTSVERATRLTGHLLAFSRQKTHLKETADLCRHLTSLEEVLRRSLREDIEIRLLVDQSPCFVSVDISELELALLNVAVNARDAMPNGGTLSITVQKVSLRGDETPEGLKGGFVRIAVEDTGVGITPDVIARVFEPFFTTKDIGKGTGLGLSQVYGFVHQSNGAITINSVLGKGTTVLMYLPTVSAPELSAPAANPAYIKDAQLNKTVLVVEDNLEVSRVCRAYLEQLGYQVVEVSAANAALDLMASDAKIDIVITDIVMPGGTNGVELARQLRSKHPRLPIVLTTGYTAQTALDTSEFPLLRKPYNLDELRKRLGEAISHAA